MFVDRFWGIRERDFGVRRGVPVQVAKGEEKVMKTTGWGLHFRVPAGWLLPLNPQRRVQAQCRRLLKGGHILPAVCCLLFLLTEGISNSLPLHCRRVEKSLGWWVLKRKNLTFLASLLLDACNGWSWETACIPVLQ